MFELHDPGARDLGQLVAGGRYDGLLARIGSPAPIPAVGFAVWIERLAAREGVTMSAPFVIAMPAKGRLQENAQAFFARAGLELVKPRGARNYRGTIADLPGIEVAYLSAAEIAQLLAQGAVHFGITGEDLLREMIPDVDARIVFIDALGFGHANVVVAVPQAWIDVHGMADLDDVATAFRLRHDRKMRLATKYVNLTRAFFSAQGITDYRIVESTGATEGAPAAGTAELIVDITTTGTTLAANAPQGDRRRPDPALAGQSGGGPHRPLGRARARDRPPGARPHRRAGTRARLSRGAHPFRGLRRNVVGAGQAALRGGKPVRRTDLLRHGDLALSARATCMRWRASCASMAPRTSRWRISTTCSRARMRCSRGCRPGSAEAHAHSVEMCAGMKRRFAASGCA